MTMKLIIIFIISVLVVTAMVAGLTVFINFNKGNVVSSFETCQQAGYPILETFPEQCKTPDGRTFTNVDKEPNQGQCYVGGCSNELCSDQEGVVSTCIYKEEYVCYKTATCQRQQNGQCGWTQTPALTACLNGSDQQYVCRAVCSGAGTNFDLAKLCSQQESQTQCNSVKFEDTAHPCEWRSVNDRCDMVP